MRRHLCVWCPNWPLDRLRRTRRSANPSAALADSFILAETGAQGRRVAAADAVARASGIEPGLSVADACARLPGLRIEEIDRDADAKALNALAGWATRWSPRVAVDGRDGLLLDITGCARFFGGEDRILGDIQERLDAMGVSIRLGVADTVGAAWALAHIGQNGAIAPWGETRQALAKLPMAGLRLSEPVLNLLRRFGLVRIEQLYGIDRRSLARRFQSASAADQVVLRLDQALGRRQEPITPWCAPPAYEARLPCPEPVLHTEGVAAGLARLVRDVCAELETGGEGAREIVLRAFLCDGGVSEVFVSTARPVRDPGHILRLFKERIERIDPGFGIDLLTLEARRTGAMSAAAQPLKMDVASAAYDIDAVSALADRIVARLGSGRVVVSTPHASHWPGRAERFEPFRGFRPDWQAMPEASRSLRPVRLLPRPEPIETLATVPDGPPRRFRWRRVSRNVVRADGPERIAPEWWRLDTDAERRARDYYRVEDEAGRRYWVFRDGLHGDGRGEAPQWFLHGLFA